MRFKRCVLAGLIYGILVLPGRGETTVEPPVAPQMEHREVRHGAAVVDEYHWLREKSNPRVLAHLEAENAYTDTMTEHLKPFEQVLYQEMLGRIKQTDLSVPVARGRYDYYTRTAEGRQYATPCRRLRGSDAPEEVLLDVNELAAGHTFFALGAFSVSDDENLLAYTTDTTGFRQYVLHVKDLRTGETLGDTCERVTSLQWAGDDRTLFLTTEDEVTKRANHFWRHTLAAAKPESVYEEPDELFHVRVLRTRDKAFVLLQIASAEATEVRYLPADQPRAEAHVFLPREAKHRYYVDHRQGLFYIRTNKGAKNFRIVTADDQDFAPPRWKEFVSHRDDVLIDGVDLFENHAVVREKSRALNELRVFDFAARRMQRGIAFPEPVYAAFGMENPDSRPMSTGTATRAL